MNVHALRRALHQAVDLVVDAIAEDTETPKAKRPRAYARPAVELPDDVTHEELEAVRKSLEKGGFRRVG